MEKPRPRIGNRSARSASCSVKSSRGRVAANRQAGQRFEGMPYTLYLPVIPSFTVTADLIAIWHFVTAAPKRNTRRTWSRLIRLP